MPVQTPYASRFRANPAFENGRAEMQRAIGKRPWRRAAQRERWAPEK
jgi:hypothetical protein